MAQITVPRVVLPVRGRIFVRMPYRKGNRDWIKQVTGKKTRPDWNRDRQRWEISRAHLGIILKALLFRFDVVDFFREYKTTQRCDIRCLSATGHDCECSCMGKHHGSKASGGGWMEGMVAVGDYTMQADGDKTWSHVRLRNK